MTTGNKHDYLLCYCPIVGIIFEVLRINKLFFYKKTCFTRFNTLLGEKWKCDMMLELSDCMDGFSNYDLSYDEAKYCLYHVGSD